MSQAVERNKGRVYRVVLTGGPCGGKTTGQARLCTFFENLGWKVYRVPETATVLMSGGVKWTDLTDEQVFEFQLNLMRTMLQIEQTFFDLAASSRSNVLIICDRGIMDASAYLKPGQWDKMKMQEKWNEVDLRDNRYNQVIHMVSAAKGAESFYGTDHVTRYEGIELARELDTLASQAWVGHPYFDVIDNTTDFEQKVIRMIASVCHRIGLDVSDRLHMDSRKRKFLVASLPKDIMFPQFQDFMVIHDYLVTPESKMQARIRRRGQNVKWDASKGKWDLDTENPMKRYQISRVHHHVTKEEEVLPHLFLYGTDQDFLHFWNWTYTHTIRRPEINKTTVETKMQISPKEYELLLCQKDNHHYTIHKKRRCFLWNNQYFQMDIYQEPCHPRCAGLILLETYTTRAGAELKLPDFLNIIKEVTSDPNYSMYNLSKKDEIVLSPRVSQNGVPLKNGEPITNGVVA